MLLFSFSATTSNCDKVVITSFDSVLLLLEEEEELELPLDVIEFFGVSLVEEVDVEENSSEKKNCSMYDEIYFCTMSSKNVKKISPFAHCFHLRYFSKWRGFSKGT